MLTVFFGPDELPIDTPNGEGWCLRAYRQKPALVALPRTDTGSTVKPFPMRPVVVEEDYPCWDDLAGALPEEDADRLDDVEDELENVPGLKLGGWPTLIQSEIFWAPWNEHPANPEYVFQIDSDGEGDVGVRRRRGRPLRARHHTPRKT